jgi:hypothetical protein
MVPGGDPARRRRGGSRFACRGVFLKAASLLVLLCLLPLASAKRGPRIPDDLDNVVDSEEDEAFKAWGRTKGDAGDDMPRGMGAGQGGAQLAFARLTPDPTGKRTVADVNVIAAQWATLLRSGAMSEMVYAVDETTVLISIPDGSLLGEVREFLWLQDVVEAFEWNSQMWLKGESEPRPRTFTERPKKKTKTKTKTKTKKKSGKRRRARVSKDAGDEL